MIVSLFTHRITPVAFCESPRQPQPSQTVQWGTNLGGVRTAGGREKPKRGGSSRPSTPRRAAPQPSIGSSPSDIAHSQRAEGSHSLWVLRPQERRCAGKSPPLPGGGGCSGGGGGGTERRRWSRLRARRRRVRAAAWGRVERFSPLFFFFFSSSS